MSVPSLKTRKLQADRLAVWASANGTYMHATGRAEDVVKLLIEFEALAETRLPVPTELSPLFGRLRLIDGQLSLDEGESDASSNPGPPGDPGAVPRAAASGPADREHGPLGQGRAEKEVEAA